MYSLDMTTIIILCCCVFLLILLWILNNYPFLYKEPSTAIEPDIEKVFDPSCAPIRLQNPDHDKLVIFVHGFPAAPATYAWSAPWTFQQGFDVYVPPLPGFGTTPDDLVKTSWTQWYGYLRKEYLEARSHYSQVFIIGTSMGGALTLRLAEEFSGTNQAPDAIATCAAPVYMNALLRHRALTSPALYGIRTIGWFVPKLGTGINTGKAPEKDVDGDSGWKGYSGKFPRQIYSLLMALKQIEKQLPSITVPAYLAHARKDTTVSSKNLFTIAKKIQSDNIRVQLVDLKDIAHSHHCLPLYPSVRESIIGAMLDFFKTIPLQEKQPANSTEET